VSDYLRHIKESGHGSVLEHVNYSLLIWGVSRALTHELVRHRAGFGFSQVSQRYVAGKHLRFVETPATQFDEAAGSMPCPSCGGSGEDRKKSCLDSHSGYHDCRTCDGKKTVVAYDILAPEGAALAAQRVVQADLHYGFERWIDASAEEYQRREALLLRKAGIDYKTATTDQRKAVRQEARRCLPNETEAPAVVTGNLRAWRHCIEQRCSPFADAEICRASFQWFEALRSHEPLLWEDYVVDSKRADGLPTVSTPYRKV
jgi:thymidylate synthase (FAD)